MHTYENTWLCSYIYYDIVAENYLDLLLAVPSSSTILINAAAHFLNLPISKNDVG